MGLKPVVNNRCDELCIFGARSIAGTLTGTAIDEEDMLTFSVREQVRPTIETVPLERDGDAYARMMRRVASDARRSSCGERGGTDHGRRSFHRSENG